MAYLHKVGIIHGRLSALVCLIDSRWNVKLSHWQMLSLSVQQHDRKLSSEYGSLSAGFGISPLPGSCQNLTVPGASCGHHMTGGMNTKPSDMCALAPELRHNHEARPTKASDAYSFRFVLLWPSILLLDVYIYYMLYIIIYIYIYIILFINL